MIFHCCRSHSRNIIYNEIHGLLLNIIAKISLETRDKLNTKILHCSISLFLYASEIQSKDVSDGLDNAIIAKKFENVTHLLLNNWIVKFKSNFDDNITCNDNEIEVSVVYIFKLVVSKKAHTCDVLVFMYVY